MKKIFTLAAAVVAALVVNAQDAIVYDFTAIAGESDYIVQGATKNTKESTASKIVYDIPAPESEESPSPAIDIDFPAYPNLHLSYSNANGKEKAMAIGIDPEGKGKGYVEFGGARGTITLINLLAEAEVTFHLCAKGEKPASFQAIEGAAENEVVDLTPKKSGWKDMSDEAKAEAMAQEGCDSNGLFWVDIKRTAIARTMVAQELQNGYRITKITIEGGEEWGEEEAVENVAGVVKAHKVIENGQLVLIKNGVRFNALGAKL